MIVLSIHILILDWGGKYSRRRHKEYCRLTFSAGYDIYEEEWGDVIDIIQNSIDSIADDEHRSRRHPAYWLSDC